MIRRRTMVMACEKQLGDETEATYLDKVLKGQDKEPDPISQLITPVP